MNLRTCKFFLVGMVLGLAVFSGWVIAETVLVDTGDYTVTVEECTTREARGGNARCTICTDFWIDNDLILAWRSASKVERIDHPAFNTTCVVIETEIDSVRRWDYIHDFEAWVDNAYSTMNTRVTYDPAEYLKKVMGLEEW